MTAHHRAPAWAGICHRGALGSRQFPRQNRVAGSSGRRAIPGPSARIALARDGLRAINRGDLDRLIDLNLIDPDHRRIAPQAIALAEVQAYVFAAALATETGFIEEIAFRHIGETDCVADDAVSIGLVSTANSLLTGKLTGNFVDSRPLPRFRRPVG